MLKLVQDSRQLVDELVSSERDTSLLLNSIENISLGLEAELRDVCRRGHLLSRCLKVRALDHLVTVEGCQSQVLQVICLLGESAAHFGTELR